MCEFLGQKIYYDAYIIFQGGGDDFEIEDKTCQFLVRCVLRSIYTSIALRCFAAVHSLHSDCGTTAWQCRNEVKFIVTRNAVDYVELW